MPPESGEQKRYCRLMGLPPLGFGRVSVACGSKNPIVGTMQRPRLMGSSHSPGLSPSAVSMRVLKSKRLAQFASKPQRSSVASSSPMPGTMTGAMAPGRASGPAGQSGRQLKGACIWMRRMTSATSSMVSILKRPHIICPSGRLVFYCLSNQPMMMGFPFGMHIVYGAMDGAQSACDREWFSATHSSRRPQRFLAKPLGSRKRIRWCVSSATPRIDAWS